MSNTRSANPGQRQGDYSNVGFAGRKTGVTLKQTTARDEYGMPLLDDLFSPPQRAASPVKTSNQVSGKSTSEGSTRARLKPNVQPNLSQSSSPRKAPPPRARSPIKTSIGSPRKSINGSPAKTMALLASPMRRGNNSRLDNSVSKADAKDDFANNKHKRRSLEQAPKRPTAPMSGSVLQLKAPRRSLFEVPSSPAVRLPASTHANLSSTIEQSPSIAKGVSPQVLQPTKSSDVVRHTKTSRLQVMSEPELFVSQDSSPEQSPEEEFALPVVTTLRPIQQNSAAKAKNKRRWSDIEAEEKLQATKKRSKSSAQLKDVQETSEPVQEAFEDDDEIGFVGDDWPDQAPEELPVEIGPDSQSPSSQASAQRSPILQANAEMVEAGSPKLSAKPSPTRGILTKESQQFSPVKVRSPAAVRSASKPVPLRQPKERDANIVTMLSKGKNKANHQKTEAQAMAPPPLPAPLTISRPKRRGLQILKDKEQEEPDIARYSRAGRLTARPTEYWGFERVVYSETNGKRGNRSKTTKKQTKRQMKQKSTSSRIQQVSEESEYEDVEELWEVEPGIYSADLPTWDPVQQCLDADVLEQVDIAVAPAGLEKLINTAPSGGFQLAKTLTLPYYHAGMIDIPPGGEKASRQSRRFHLTFWVRKGRVAVNVSGHEISIGKDSMWQVPRGCTYSVSNPYDQPARLYFSQGAYMTEEEGRAAERAQHTQQAQE